MSEKDNDSTKPISSDNDTVGNNGSVNRMELSQDTNVNNTATVASSNESFDTQDRWIPPGDSWVPPIENQESKTEKLEDEEAKEESKCEQSENFENKMSVEDEKDSCDDSRTTSPSQESGIEESPMDEDVNDTNSKEYSENNDVPLKVELPPLEQTSVSDASESSSALTVELPPLKHENGSPTEEASSSPQKGDSNSTSSSQSEDGTADKKSTETASANDANVYHVKWITFRNKEFPVITQNENGPCPLIALMNVLLLKGKVHLNQSTELITPDQLMTYVGNSILENAPKAKEVNEAIQLNYEQNMQDAMAVIHKLQTGLDVNVRFTGVRDFEYTPECIIFDLLSISLYHGWLVDPQDSGLVNAVGTCSYNLLVEKVISQRSSDKPELVTEALLAESFLDRTASQLTYHGLCELNTHVKENQLCVFFRNNHFSTMYRHQNELFLLVTDQGFLNERNVVWETLSNVEGDGYFVDANFHTYRKPPPPAEPVAPIGAISGEEQVDQDYLLAMSLQHEQQMRDDELWSQNQQPQQRPQLSDHEIAARLQAEEDERAALAVQQQYQQQQNPQPRPPQQQRSPQGGAAGGHGTPSRRPRERESSGRSRDKSREKEKDSQCCIL